MLQCKSSEQPLCSFVSEIWNNNGKVDQSFFERFEQNGLTINRFSADCGSCSEEIVEKIEKHCKSFYIRANRCSSIYNDTFALKGWKTEEINGIEFELNSILVEKWKGKAYRLVIQRLDVKKFGLNTTSRIKAFVFRLISVPAKWIRTSRRYVLNIYTSNNAYADVFQTDFG